MPNIQHNNIFIKYSIFYDLSLIKEEIELLAAIYQNVTQARTGLTRYVMG